MGGDSSLGHRQMAERVGGGEKAEGPPPTEEIAPGTPKAAPQGGGQQLDVSHMHSTTCPAGEQRQKAAVHTLSVLCPGSELVPGTTRLTPRQDFSLCLCCRCGYKGRRSPPSQQRQLVLGPRPARLPGPHPTLLCAFTATSLSSNTLWAGTSSRGSRGSPTTPPGTGSTPNVRPRPSPRGSDEYMHTCSWGGGRPERLGRPPIRTPHSKGKR